MFHKMYVETAKLYEHQCKDDEKALYYTTQVYESWKKKGGFYVSVPKLNAVLMNNDSNGCKKRSMVSK